MSEVITSAEQVTPEWLAGILRARQCPSSGKGIPVQEVTCSRHIATWFADISFLEVGYSGRDPRSAPNRLCLKISRPNLGPADLLYGKKEVQFYNTVAVAMVDPPVPRCYDAVFAQDTGMSHLLMDDLSGTHSQPEPPLPPSMLGCELAMDCLAQIHAGWWDHPMLWTEIGGLPHGEPADEGGFGFPHSSRKTVAMFPGFADFLGDRLSAARKNLYERVLSSWPFARYSERVSDRRNITLIHGDAHAWNFLYPRNPGHDRVRIIDWHEWGISLGTNDLAEMMVLWWHPERRARLEEALLRRYHRQLMTHGVEGYDWEQCWDDYRLSAFRILLYPVWMYAEGRPTALWLPILERGMLAFQDLGCIDLLG